jgi:hypothetical protein
MIRGFRSGSRQHEAGPVLLFWDLRGNAFVRFLILPAHFTTPGKQRMPAAPLETAERAALESELRDLERVADWMDTRFKIPGTEIRFGLDGLLGLVPGIGDGVLALPALYLIARARGMGAPTHVQARMAGNVVLDLLIGAVPLVGDLFDIGYKANTRNVRLLREHFGLPPRPGPTVR